ncbi:MAG: prolipoprotein diacylglyceryl transferase, partial [Alistipes sp.]|nr:prolipoprotein diacylglyceryl transferase [Alistipes sp.]
GIFLTRFCIEFIKLEQEAFEKGMLLDMGQILSIPFILLGIYIIYRALSKPAVDVSDAAVKLSAVAPKNKGEKSAKKRKAKW